MFLIAIVVLVLQVLWAESTLAPKSVPDYYWRDYDGLVPKDAVQGGFSSGRPTFIGQFNIPRGDKNDIVPATITENSPIGRAAYYGVRESTSDSNLKILCFTDNSSSILEWWSSEIEAIPSYWQRVIGGKESGIIHYIGRATLNNGQIINGKVPANTSPLKLMVPTDDGQEAVLYAFVILTAIVL